MRIAGIYIILLCGLLFSCTGVDREKPVDKSKLTGRDYRLFQGTPAWTLAKAVEDEDIKEIAEIVSQEPAIVNYQEPKYGNTLLKITVMNQQMKSFKALLENGADVNIHNTYTGASALIEACSFRRYDIEYAELLLKKGANVNDVETGKRQKWNSTRFTPLMAASQSGKLEIVELLLKNGANVNYKNEYGQTALSRAVMVKKYDVAIFLLQNGADYKQPIFYRPDYSVPSELQEPNDKGKPMYLVDVLREDFMDLDTEEYKYKMQIVAFLKSKGIDYRKAPIPDYIKKKAQENYPDSWKEYLEKY